MFKNMSHSYKLMKSPFDESYMLHVYLNRLHKLPKANLTIFSNQILDGVVMNCNLEQIVKKKFNISSLNKDEISQYIFDKNLFKQEIYFPKNKFFATYKYTFPTITLYPETTIILCAETTFEPMSLVLRPGYPSIKSEEFYKFTITENLLGK